VYLCAFWSFGTQVLGLIGQNGILPATDYMAAVGRAADSGGFGLLGRFFAVPTLCWWSTSDTFLQGLCAVGVVLSLFVITGVGSAIALPLLWLMYLSLSHVARDFLGFQWDALLLETGVLAVLVAPLTIVERPGAHQPPRGARWLIWWLVFRLMFASGIVKLASGDPTWRSLTALMFHYETQPLPTPLGWYAHQLPPWFQKASTAGTLFVELAMPWLILTPRRLRATAGVTFILLQLLIALTGNYAFFNLLTIALALTLLDDAHVLDVVSGFWRTVAKLSVAYAFRRTVPASDVSTATADVLTATVGPTFRSGAHGLERIHRVAVAAIAILTVPVSIVILAGQAGIAVPGASLVTPLYSVIEPFRSVNGYGLFAVMTTTRPELVVEGSNDGGTWVPYEFKYKPGRVDRPLAWVAPHQPRLDWQMWFAALGTYEEEAWVEPFCRRLLEGSKPVIDLLAVNPFADKPPAFIRVMKYQYRFTDRATRQRDHAVWRREIVGPYSPVLWKQDRPGG
jgi:hypothetical protein